jgi:hypothetical protein
MGGKGSGNENSKKTFTRRQKKQIAAAYDSGREPNLNKLANKHHVHVDRIKEILADEDVPIKRKGRQPKTGGVHVTGCMRHVGGSCMPMCGR